MTANQNGPSSNWRLSSREIAHISFALKELLKQEVIPKEIYGMKFFSNNELESFVNRFEKSMVENIQKIPPG